MASIDSIRGTSTGSRTSPRSRLFAGRESEAPAVEDSRALVVVQPPPRVAPTYLAGGRASASFLAHLIAIDQQAPQTRPRRRIEPAQASLAYRTAGALIADDRGLALSKVC